MALALAACGDPEPPVKEPWAYAAQGARVVLESGPTYSRQTFWNNFAKCFWNGGCPTEYWTWKLRLFPLTPERAWQQAQELYEYQFSDIKRWQQDGRKPPYAKESLEFSQLMIEQNCKDGVACDEPNLKNARETAAREARYVACAEAVLRKPQESKTEWDARLMSSQADGVAYSALYSVSSGQASDTDPERRGSYNLLPILDDACPDKH